MSLEKLLDSGIKLLLFGGKGGVGKTTCAVACGFYAAKNKGLKTLVISTDPAHSLTDSLDMPYDKGIITRVIDNFYAIQLDPQKSLWDQSYFMNLQMIKMSMNPSLNEAYVNSSLITEDKIKELMDEFRDIDLITITYSLILNKGEIDNAKKLIKYADSKADELAEKINNPNYKRNHAMATLIMSGEDYSTAEEISKDILKCMPINCKDFSLTPGQMERHSFNVIYSMTKSIDSGKADYDLVIIDTAPTGHTLEMLSQAHLLRDEDGYRWMMKTLLPVSWTIMKTVRGVKVVNKFFKRLLGRDSKKTIDKIPGLREQYKQLKVLAEEFAPVMDWFSDCTKSYFIPVVIPTEMAFEETLDLVGRLSEFELGCYKLMAPKSYYDKSIGEHDSLKLFHKDYPRYIIMNSLLCNETIDIMKRIGVKELPSEDCGFCRMQVSEHESMLKKVLDYDYDLGDTVILIPDLPWEVRGLERIELFSKLLVEGGELIAFK